MENLIITDFDEKEHSDSIYNISIRGKFYPQDVFLNAFEYKRICPLILKVIQHNGKSKEEINTLLHNAIEFLNKTATENSEYGYVALDENKVVIGYLIYNELKENPTTLELTFIFVEEE